MMRRSLKQRDLYFIIGLVIVSLIGVQLYWMTTVIRLQKLAAERSLRSDLSNVVKEAGENAYCFYFYSKAFIKKDEGLYIIKQQFKDGKFVGAPTGYLDTLSLYNLFFQQNDTFFDRSSFLDFQTPATVDISMKFKFAMPSPHVKKIDTNSYKLPNIDMAHFRQALKNSQSLDELINPDNLDSMIKVTLRKNNYDTVYEMGIRRVGAARYEYLTRGSKPAHLESGLVSMQFLGDNFNTPYQLQLYLPDPAGHTIRSMAFIMAGSIVVILLLIISYAYFVRTILNQKKLSEMKSMFINNITHEFNTPITNIQLAVENWRHAGVGNPFYANIIEEENRHLQNNVEQMLQLATMDHPHITPYFERTDLNCLIKETAASFSMQLDSVRGDIDYRLAPGLWLWCDRSLVRNLLYNLIDNAIKYSGDGVKITIATLAAGGNAEIEIRDNGPGMPQETVKYMFERFYRGAASRHDVKGFGIGLSYVKYIADVHKARIDVKSREGEGTEITIIFPRAIKD